MVSGLPLTAEAVQTWSPQTMGLECPRPVTGTRQRTDFALESEVLEATCVETRTPLADVLTHERARHVQSGLRQLGRMDRETLEAFYVDGQSLVEMSDRFDAPVGTIKRRLHVARKRLARHVEAVAAV